MTYIFLNGSDFSFFLQLALVFFLVYHITEPSYFSTVNTHVLGVSQDFTSIYSSLFTGLVFVIIFKEMVYSSFSRILLHSLNSVVSKIET